MNVAFSPDLEFLAQCGNDGKLRIFETQTGKLKQEFVSKQHLSSPCSTICWLGQSNVTPSPWKKRRRKEEPLTLVLGSSSGSLTLYDVSLSTARNLTPHSSSISALTYSGPSDLICASEDHYLSQINTSNLEVITKWKAGKFKINCLKVTEDGKWLFSGCKFVKWWDLETKKVLRKFAPVQSSIGLLGIVGNNGKWEYIVGGAGGESALGVWSLDETDSETTTVATLSLQDDAVSLSTLSSASSTTKIISVTRSGQCQIFNFHLNSRGKPLKPNLTLAVANETSNEVQQIPILSAEIISDNKVIIVYGSWVQPLFERIELDFSEKVQCLVRKGEKRKEKKEDVGKTWNVVEDGAEYVNSGHSPAVKRNRSTSGSQIPLQDRLENLSISSDPNQSGKTIGKGNLIQLLMQGLNSKDRNILTNVLFTKNENIIKNTVAKLPIEGILPLLRELTILLQGKTYSSKTAVLWLEALLSQHAAHFLAMPNVSEAFGPILSLIDAKLSLFGDICKLKGRVALVTGQISQATEKNEDTLDEGVLVYQDADSSEEDAGIQEEDLQSSSDSNWEEMSNDEAEEDPSSNEESM